MMRTKWTKRLLAALLLTCLAAAGLAAVSVHAETPGTGTLVVAENFENRTLSDWHAYFWKDGAAQVELATGDAAITGRQSLKVTVGGEYPFFYGFFNQDMAPKKNQTPYTVCLKIRQTNLERFTVCAGNNPWEDVDASVVYLENGLPTEPFGTTVDTAASVRDEETGVYSVRFTFTKSDKPQCYFWIGGHAKDPAKSSTMTVDEVYLFEGAVAGAGAKVVGRDMEDPELTADNVFEKVSFWADGNYPVAGEGAVNATFDVVTGAEAISGTQSLRVTTPAQYNNAAGFCGFLNNSQFAKEKHQAYFATLKLKVSANVRKFTLAVGPSPFGSNAAIFGWLTESKVLDWQSGTHLLRVEQDEAGVYTIGFLFNTDDSAEMYFLLGGETTDGEPAWAVVDDFELWKGYRDDVNEPSGQVVPETPAFAAPKTVQSFGAGANEYLVATPDEAKFANEIAVSGTGVSGTWADGKVIVDVPAGYAEETVTVTLRSANRTDAAYCKEERFTLWNENYSALAAVNTFDYARLGDDWEMSWSSMFFGRPVENGPISRLTAPDEGINGISYAYPIPDAADGGPVMVSKADQFSFLSGNLYTVQLKVKKIPDVLFSVDIGWSFAMGCGIRLGDGSIEWSSETAGKPFLVETADRGTYLDVTLTFEMIAGATDIRFFGKKPTSMGATDIVIDDVAVFEGFGRNLGTKRAVAGAAMEADNAALTLDPAFAAVTTDQSLVLNGMGSVLGDAPVTADANVWAKYLTLNAAVKGSTVYTLKFRYRILSAAGVKFGVTLDHDRDELDDFLYFNESGVLPSEIKGRTTAYGSFPGPTFVANSVLGYMLAPGDAGNELTVTFFSGADDGYLGVVFNCNGGGKIVFDDIELTEGLLADALAEAVKTPAPKIAIAAADPAGKQDKEQAFTLPATASVTGGKDLTYAAETDSGVAVSWDGTTVRVGALPFEYSAATLVVELTASLSDASFVCAKKTITVQINTPAVPEITISDTLPGILYRGESAVLAGVTATLDGEGFTTSATAPAGVAAQWDHAAGKLTIALSAGFAGDEVSVVLKAVLDADARLWAERTLTFAVAESFRPAVTLPLTDLAVTKGESKNFAVLVRYAGAGVTVTVTAGEGVTLSWKDDVLTVLVAESYAAKTVEVTITAAGTDVSSRTETKTLTLSVRDKSTDGTVDGGDGSDEPTDGEQGGCGGSAAGAATLAAFGLLLAAAALCSVKRTS